MIELIKTVKKEFIVKCDGVNCNEMKYYEEGFTKKQVKESLKDIHSWKEIKGKWFCPSCK